MERRKRWFSVDLTPDSIDNARCRVLKLLQTADVFGRELEKQGVAIVKSRKDECSYPSHNNTIQLPITQQFTIQFVHFVQCNQCPILYCLDSSHFLIHSKSPLSKILNSRPNPKEVIVSAFRCMHHFFFQLCRFG